MILIIRQCVKISHARFNHSKKTVQFFQEDRYNEGNNPDSSLSLDQDVILPAPPF